MVDTNDENVKGGYVKVETKDGYTGTTATLCDEGLSLSTKGRS